jgi:hypothetical protein
MSSLARPALAHAFCNEREDDDRRSNMAHQSNQGTQQDPLANKSSNEAGAQEPPEAAGADGPQGAAGVSETSDRTNYYEELGMKHQRGTPEQQEQLRPEPSDASTVDKSRVDPHQAEGPGGKGGFGGGGA